jgi:hypothetical protein
MNPLTIASENRPQTDHAGGFLTRKDKSKTSSPRIEYHLPEALETHPRPLAGTQRGLESVIALIESRLS